MHAIDQLGSGSLLALITGLIIFIVIAYVIFRKRN